MEPLITCNHVNYTYHTLQGETPALRNIDFQVKKGEFVTLEKNTSIFIMFMRNILV